jgi:class 3 adenylate cyclase
VIRLAWKLLALAGGVLLAAGFVAQFSEFDRFRWAWWASDATAPIAGLVHGIAPTRWGPVDVALLLALVALYVVYAVGDHGLKTLEAGGGDQAATRYGSNTRSSGSRSGRSRRLVPLAERAAATSAAAGAAPGAPAGAPAASAPPAAVTHSYRSEAILVIDLVKSSDLVSRFGNSFFFSVKQRLEQLVTPIATRHGVSYSQGTGDGFLFCFPSTVNAVKAVREMIQAVPALNQGLPHDAEAALRAAVNFGEVIAERRDRTGTAVHKTFRLQGMGPGTVIEAEGGVSPDAIPQKNCVFISEEALGGMAKLPDFSQRFLGLAELKGLPGLHRVYQLEWK